MGSLKFKGRLAGLPSALGGRSSGMRPLQGHADVPGERGTHTRRAPSLGHRALSAPSTADFQLTPMCNQRTSFHDSKNHVSPWTDTHINEKRSPEIQRAVTLTCPSPNKPSSLLSPDGPQPAPLPPPLCLGLAALSAPRVRFSRLRGLARTPPLPVALASACPSRSSLLGAAGNAPSGSSALPSVSLATSSLSLSADDKSHLTEHGGTGGQSEAPPLLATTRRSAPPGRPSPRFLLQPQDLTPPSSLDS